MNIVVVTDEPVLPDFLRRPLQPLGHQLTVASSTSTFRSLVETMRPSLVLLPRRLPGSSLEEELDWLAAQPDADARVAIVLGLDDDPPELARRHGVRFLPIPFSDADVLTALDLSTRSSMLVLLVDDSPLIHAHTVPILQAEGYEVISAHDGAEGLQVARERRPNLVITDVEMPKLDGFELCRALKTDSSMAHVPVLISSSLGEAHDLERGFDAGADDYLVKPVVPEELTTRAAQLLSASIPASRDHILVVDDSPAQRHYVADCLARQGFVISTAENGRVALDKALKDRPTLVVSDYEMPEMTGFELVHALRLHPATRNIPVIMLTARDSKRDMAQMRAAGASAYLVKPFAQDKCIAMVERTLAEKRLRDYKLASRVYISEGARRAAEQRAASGDIDSVRADERMMSVLFSDLVGFTNMSSKMTPRQVIENLNDYFDMMCPIITELDGDIDKFIGDAIMAVFDELPGKATPAERAVRAALAMQECMPSFNANRAVPLAMRIGINTGPLVRGDLGARMVRRDYTVIGDTVNRANRYEMTCPPGGVLVSESTRLALDGKINVESRPGLILKGVAEPVTAYVVKGFSNP